MKVGEKFTAQAEYGNIAYFRVEAEFEVISVTRAGIHTCRLTTPCLVRDLTHDRAHRVGFSQHLFKAVDGQMRQVDSRSKRLMNERRAYRQVQP